MCLGLQNHFLDSRLSCLFVLSHLWLFAALCTVICQAPLSMEFSRQWYCSGLPFPPPGDLPDSGIELTSLASPALQAGSLPLAQPWKLPDSIDSQISLRNTLPPPPPTILYTPILMNNTSVNPGEQPRSRKSVLILYFFAAHIYLGNHWFGFINSLSELFASCPGSYTICQSHLEQ